MNNATTENLKIFTPQDVIIWLKTRPSDEQFHWSNEDENPCLFGKFASSYFENPIFCNGRGKLYIINDGGRNTSFIGQVPFHNNFWELVCGTDDIYFYIGEEVTAKEAIEILEKL